MLLNEQLALDAESLVSGNLFYNSYSNRWKFLLESYLGGEEYRQAGHLTRYQLETEQEYAARLDSTPLENHCASVVSVYKSFLFRQEPIRELGTLENLPEVESFLKDADMEGRSLNSFMKDVATWSSVFGHAWIIVAKPDVGAMTLADEQAVGVRPYVSVLTPMVVLDWEWARMPNGRYELQYFKYIEDVNGDITVVKEWFIDAIRTTFVDVVNSQIQDSYVEPNGLGKIPAVIAYANRSTVRGIGVSDITDIADAQKLIYNCTSEIYESIRLDSHPSLVTTPEVNIGTGAGSIIKMPENMDPGLKPYLLEFNGASISSIYESIKHTISSIDKMANTGAVRATESRTMSGVAMETEFQLLNAKLSEKADNLELAEEQMWKLWCEYMGRTWDGEVDYPGSFNIRDTGSEIQQLATARGAATSPLVLKEIDKQILEWMDVDDDVLETMADEMSEYANQPFEPHMMYGPNGEQQMANTMEEHLALAQQGWIHEGDM